MAKIRKKKIKTSIVCLSMGKALRIETTRTLSPLMVVMVRRGLSTLNALSAFKLGPPPSSSTFTIPYFSGAVNRVR